MAVATPVLERSSVQELEDRKHDLLIKERYAKLINPELRMNDLKNEPVREETEIETPVQAVFEEAVAEEAQERVTETHTYRPEPYLAPSGRADAEIFRADSAINRRLRGENQVKASAAETGAEEENEDLIPTLTTRQYGSKEESVLHEEGGKISTDSKKHINLSKRDIAVIATVVTVIVALFVLIIVNSAIISGINSDLSKLQSSLNTVRGAFSSVSDQINDYVANHLEENVRKLGESLGMVR